jgi:hypothetical protein
MGLDSINEASFDSLINYVIFFLFSDALGLGFTITPQEKVVLPNEAVSILCKVSLPFSIIWINHYF